MTQSAIYLSRVVSHAPPVPWTHGMTSQIGIFPEDARCPGDPFLWRVSTATVTAPKPADRPIRFSPLPDHDRIILLLKGKGMVLNHGPHGHTIVDRPLIPHRFSGAWPTTCALMGGDVVDFNVMVRRGKANASVKTWTLPAHEPDDGIDHGSVVAWAGAHQLFCCVTGGFQVICRAAEQFFYVAAGNVFRSDLPPRRDSHAAARNTVKITGSPGGAVVVGVDIFIEGRRGRRKREGYSA